MNMTIAILARFAAILNVGIAGYLLMPLNRCEMHKTKNRFLSTLTVRNMEKWKSQPTGSDFVHFYQRKQ